MRRPFETITKIISGTASNEDNQHSGYKNAENNNTLSEGSSTSPHSGHGIDQDGNIMSDDNNSQHTGKENDQHITDCMSNSPKNDSGSSSGSLPELNGEYLNKLENSIIKDLPFAEEDFKNWGLLPRSFVQQFPLCPLKDPDEDDL